VPILGKSDSYAHFLDRVPVRLVFLGLVLACRATGGSGGGLWIAVVNFMGHGVKIRFFSGIEVNCVVGAVTNVDLLVWPRLRAINK
jgi:hypothetical protein